jgi:hypothetical protein
MPRPKIIREWIELSEGFLLPSEKPGDYEAALFINSCELREVKGGTLLVRITGIKTIKAATKDEMSRKVRDFAMREDVRRLVKGVESNDFHTLPREQRNPPQGIVDGTDDVYQTAEEPTEA